MQQLQESHSQSDFKLPSIDIHTTHRLPIKMNPSYRLKFTNPIRVQYLRFLDRRSLDEKLNEPFCLEKFAKINNYSYEKSYEYQQRCRKPQRRTQPQQRQEYRKPTMKYFNPEDSEVRQDDMDLILNPKQNKPLLQLLIAKSLFLNEFAAQTNIFIYYLIWYYYCIQERINIIIDTLSFNNFQSFFIFSQFIIYQNLYYFYIVNYINSIKIQLSQQSRILSKQIFIGKIFQIVHKQLFRLFENKNIKLILLNCHYF